MPKASPRLVLLRLRGGQAGRRLLLRATAVQVREEQQCHDQSGNKRVRVHRLRALRHALVNKDVPAAVGELYDGRGCRCAQQGCGVNVSCGCLEALQEIADDEQQGR